LGCSKCNSLSTTYRFTECGHVTCQKCFEDDACEDTQTCNKCGKGFVEPEIIRASAATARETLSSKPHNNVKKERVLNEFLAPLRVESKVRIPASAKTLFVKAIILNWIMENPSVKIAVFTEHRVVLNLISKVLDEEAISWIEYQGDLRQEEKAESLNKFKTTNTQVLLATTPSGGTGLNLTEASRVLLVDTWWNDARHEQAVNRVYRATQTQRCTLIELVGEGLVEEYMYHVQAQKVKENDGIGSQSLTLDIKLNFLLGKDRGEVATNAKDPLGKNTFMEKSGIDFAFDNSSNLTVKRTDSLSP
jgi:SNF2 family DNA or RNA helicase